MRLHGRHYGEMGESSGDGQHHSSSFLSSLNLRKGLTEGYVVGKLIGAGLPSPRSGASWLTVLDDFGQTMANKPQQCGIGSFYFADFG